MRTKTTHKVVDWVHVGSKISGHLGVERVLLSSSSGGSSVGSSNPLLPLGLCCSSKSLSLCSRAPLCLDLSQTSGLGLGSSSSSSLSSGSLLGGSSLSESLFHGFGDGWGEAGDHAGHNLRTRVKAMAETKCPAWFSLTFAPEEDTTDLDLPRESWGAATAYPTTHKATKI